MNLYNEIQTLSGVNISKDEFNTIVDRVIPKFTITQSKIYDLIFVKDHDIKTIDKKVTIHRRKFKATYNDIIRMVLDEINYKYATKNTVLQRYIGKDYEAFSSSLADEYAEYSIAEMIDIFGDQEYEYKSIDTEIMALMILKKFPYNPNIIAMSHVSLQWVDLYKSTYNESFIKKDGVENYPYLFYKNYERAISTIVKKSCGLSLITFWSSFLQDSYQFFRLVVDPESLYNDQYFDNNTLDSDINSLSTTMKASLLDKVKLNMVGTYEMTIKGFIRFVVDIDLAEQETADININEFDRIVCELKNLIIVNKAVAEEYEVYSNIVKSALEGVSNKRDE